MEDWWLIASISSISYIIFQNLLPTSSPPLCPLDSWGGRYGDTYFHYSNNRLSNIIIQIAPCSMPPKQTQRSRANRSQRADVPPISIAGSAAPTQTTS